MDKLERYLLARVLTAYVDEIEQLKREKELLLEELNELKNSPEGTSGDRVEILLMRKSSDLVTAEDSPRAASAGH